MPDAPEIWRMAVAISPSDQSVAYVWAAYAEGFEGDPASGSTRTTASTNASSGQWVARPTFGAPKLAPATTGS